MSKLSSDLEANIVRIRTEQVVSNKKLKEMIDQLRQEVLDRHQTNKDSSHTSMDANEVPSSSSSDEVTTTLPFVVSGKKCTSRSE